MNLANLLWIVPTVIAGLWLYVVIATFMKKLFTSRVIAIFWIVTLPIVLVIAIAIRLYEAAFAVGEWLEEKLRPITDWLFQ